MNYFRWLVTLTALLLSGCMVGPNFKKLPPPQASDYTHLPMPKQIMGTPQVANAGNPQQLVYGRDLQGDWWQIFHSSALNKLIAQGMENNQDLVAAKAALREANYTLYAQAGGLLLPSVNFAGTGQRTQTNAISFGVNNPNTSFDVFNATFQASYLLDIWGASRRQIESYAAQADYQRYEMLGVYLTLTTNIVTTAINIASFEEQIKETQKLIAEQQRFLNITQQQFAAGGVSEENVLAQQTTLAQTQATLPPLRKSLSVEEHALAVLVGKQTNAMPDLVLAFNQITLPKKLPVTLPSKIVEQRPDIQASEALLHAASAQIGVATANLLPQITISGDYGWLSASTNNLFTNPNNVWDIGAGLLQPVFHGGQLIMERRAVLAAFDEARAQYKQTVLQAFKNVADALRAVQYDAYELNEQAHAEQSAFKNLRLTEQQYQVGGQNYLAVLQAEQQYQTIVLARIKAQAARYSDTAALYQALGGGWWNNQTISQYGTIKDREIYH